MLVTNRTKLYLVPALFKEAAKANAPGAQLASQTCVTIAMSVVLLSPLVLVLRTGSKDLFTVVSNWISVHRVSVI